MDGKSNGFRMEALGLPLILLAALAVYLQTAWFDFVYDDVDFILRNDFTTGRDPSSPWSVFVPGFARSDLYIPVTVLVFKGVFSVFGRNPAPFHAVSIAAYLFSLSMLWIFLRRVFRDWRVSFAAVLLYALHPAHVENTAWISALGYNLAASLSYLALWLFSLCLDERSPGRIAALFSGMAAAGVLAVLCQPAAIVLPGLMLVFAFFIRRDRLPMAVMLSAAPAAMSVSAFLLFRAAVGDASRFAGAGLPLISKLEAAGMCVAKSFLPFDLMPVYPPPDNPVYIVVLAAAVAAVLAAVKKGGETAFAAVWYCVAIAPYSNVFIDLSYVMNDRYLLFPSAATCMIIAVLCAGGASLPALKGSPLRLAPAVAVASFYLLMSLAYLPVWRNELTLWNYAYSANPDSELTAGNLTFALLALGEREALLGVAATLGERPALSAIKLRILKECAPPSEALAFASGVRDRTVLFRIYLSDLFLKAGDFEKGFAEIDSVGRIPGVEALRKGANADVEVDEFYRAMFNSCFMTGRIDGALSCMPFLLKKKLPEGDLKRLESMGDSDAAAFLAGRLAAMPSPEPFPVMARLRHVFLLRDRYGKGAGAVLASSETALFKARAVAAGGRAGEALAIISPAIEADPFDGDACMLASGLSLSLGDVQKAEMYASMARRACPSRGGPDKP